ncbi:MAG: isopentenyl-diphosphate Delta-isomerase [Candidatus Aenigmarchaeota archaeon]|nr:isopentenyl-diphosphate Delta-isomerase [Candidatus Aenigmarchaeota archaeon]
MEQIILVDSEDNEIGYEEKGRCHHPKPVLHRALSVFIFNDENEMLITRRSSGKKTWPLYWSNACCSHPRKGEECGAAAKRRVKEELGIDCSPAFLFKFEYSAQYNDSWGEHELDWVFAGKHNGIIKPDKDEIKEWKFIGIEELKADVKKNPEKYTPWFRMSLERVLGHVKRNKF